MICSICGKDNKDGAQFCTSCGTPMTASESAQTGYVQPSAYPEQNNYPQQSVQQDMYQQPYPQQGGYPQQQLYPQQPQQPAFSPDLAAAAQGLYDYCKVSLEPKLNKGGIIATIVVAALVTLFFIIGGVYPLAFFSALVGLVVALLIWSSHKTNIDNSKRLINIMNHDGEEKVLGEFASAQVIANDQFRMSAHYIFIKKQAVIRIINIAKITRVTESTNFIPTGVRLDAAVGDETGDTNLTLCRLHLGKSKNEANELYDQIVARQQFAINEMNGFNV